MSKRKKAPETDVYGVPVLPKNVLRVAPLGGLGEFGKNMMTLEYEDDMIIVDCGQMFPDSDMLGVDSVIPDFTYIDQNFDRVRGLLLTHGHEDHIGALPYFLRDFDVPVYGSRLTLALVREKLREMHIEGGVELHEIHGRDKIQLGAFEIEFIQVTHSIPDAMMLAITTPLGTVFHTGDYKFDSEEEEETTDFFSLSKYGEKGVLAVFGDSTNVDREGSSPTEKSVYNGLRPIIAAAQKTVVLATFASGIHRIQTVLSLAKELGRKVALVGSSMERNFGEATKLGLLKYSDDWIVPHREFSRFPPEKRLLLCTGSQGEPLSALSRLAVDDLRAYKVELGDTIIFSARMIPGNEKGIYRTINHLYRRGARVITEKDGHVHASGHAYKDEIRQLYKILKPKYLAPIHGELRQLINHRDLGLSLGIPWEDIFILENGDALDFSATKATPHYMAGLAGQSMVDGKIFDPIEEIVLRDRKHLAEDGMIIIILVIDQKKLKIIAGPDIVSRGFVEVDRNEKLIEECKQVVVDAFEGCPKEGKEEWEVVKSAVRKALRKFLKDETDRYPVILPVVIEI